jgi:hypothetical protein
VLDRLLAQLGAGAVAEVTGLLEPHADAADRALILRR